MFWESELPFLIVMVVCMAGCLACGLLAARKGYNIYVWTMAGGVVLSFLVLAFLPFANKEPGDQGKEWEKTGNWIGVALAAVSLPGFFALILHIITS